MSSIGGKRVLITGAGSGFGRELALACASRGCRVGLADIDEAGAAETLRLVRERGGDGDTYQVDVSDASRVESMVDHFFSTLGGIDVAVNNAGVVVAGYVGDIPLDDWHWLAGVNLWGVVYGSHYLVRRMREQGGGHIVNIASAMGLLSFPDMAPYSVSKAAVISLSEILRVELAPHRVKVSVVCPMFFNTNLLSSLRYQDEFEREAAHLAFERSRVSAAEVAERTIRGIERGKFYIVPMLSGKIHWAAKRLSPSYYYWQFSLLHRLKIFRPLFKLMARLGLV
ncbi:MAG: SDR family NAD(P)-dependent oxidoreductase [Candidatus Geothermincolia bacterium]